jgi:hypothetical protein
MEIITGKQQKAQRVVVYGPEGIGKSTFASQFPEPLFIDTEGSTAQLDVARFPRPTSWAMFGQQVRMFRETDYRTLVIDTADWAEQLCIEDLCAASQKGGIEDFGYGKGFTYLAEKWGKMLNYLADIAESGRHVVVLAHAAMRKFEQPDEAGQYDRWELKLSKKCAPLLKEWADMVLFANYQTVVVEIDGKKKAQGGKRVMYTSHHACWDAKNRHGLDDVLPFSFAAVAGCFGGAGGSVEHKKTQPGTACKQSEEPDGQNDPKREAAPKPIPEEAMPDPADAVERKAIQEPAPEPEATGTRVAHTQPDAFSPKLFDLMTMHGVQEEDIRRVVASKGYYPENTPIGVYDENFVNGVLIAAWDQVHSAIKRMKETK